MVGTTHLFLVIYECVDFVVSTRNHEVSIQYRIAGYNLFKATVKLMNTVLQQPVEPVPILSTH